MAQYSCYQDLNSNDEALKKCPKWDNPWFYCAVCCNYDMCCILRSPPITKPKDDLDALLDEVFDRCMPETWFPPSDNIYTFDD
jgi:hypothetical protein